MRAAALSHWVGGRDYWQHIDGAVERKQKLMQRLMVTHWRPVPSIFEHISYHNMSWCLIMRNPVKRKEELRGMDGVSIRPVRWCSEEQQPRRVAITYYTILVIITLAIITAAQNGTQPSRLLIGYGHRRPIDAVAGFWPVVIMSNGRR